jgi:hypothetical protein
MKKPIKNHFRVWFGLVWFGLVRFLIFSVQDIAVIRMRTYDNLDKQ